MNLVSLVTFYMPLMIGFYNFFIVALYAVSNFLRSCCKLSYDDVSLPVAFLIRIGSEALIFSSIIALYPSSGIKCTGSESSESDVGVLSYCMTYSIPITKSFTFKSWIIVMVSSIYVSSILTTWYPYSQWPFGFQVVQLVYFCHNFFGISNHDCLDFIKFYKTNWIILEAFYWFNIQYLSVQQLLYPKYIQVKLWWGVVLSINIIYIK